MSIGSFNSIRYASTVSLLLLVCLTVVADPLLEKLFQNPPAEPPDVEWNTVKVRDGNNPLAAIPDWVGNGTPRPSPERRTFTTWNYIKKGQKQLPAGLLGPVTISATTDALTNK